MTNQELIKRVANDSSHNLATVRDVLEAYQSSIKAQLSNKSSISISGFGKYDVQERAERQGRNPATGESITIKASTRPTFKFSKNFLTE